MLNNTESNTTVVNIEQWRFLVNQNKRIMIYTLKDIGIFERGFYTAPYIGLDRLNDRAESNILLHQGTVHMFSFRFDTCILS